MVTTFPPYLVKKRSAQASCGTDGYPLLRVSVLMAFHAVVIAPADYALR